jgi:hypothetical protein
VRRSCARTCGRRNRCARRRRGGTRTRLLRGARRVAAVALAAATASPLEAHALKCSSGTDSDRGFCWKGPIARPQRRPSAARLRGRAALRGLNPSAADDASFARSRQRRRNRVRAASRQLCTLCTPQPLAPRAAPQRPSAEREGGTQICGLHHAFCLLTRHQQGSSQAAQAQSAAWRLQRVCGAQRRAMQHRRQR